MHAMSKVLFSRYKIAVKHRLSTCLLFLILTTCFALSAAAANPTTSNAKDSATAAKIIDSEQPSIGAWQLAAGILGVPVAPTYWLSINTEPVSAVAKCLRSFYQKVSANDEVVNQDKEDRSCSLEKLNTKQLNH
jgi:Mn2+/Fe2+ NRAMP family transporter